MNTPIFIEYETKSREFDGKLLLISQLINKGFENIYFGASRPIRLESLNHHNGIYIFKSVSLNELSFYKKLKSKGFILCLIHAEGGVYYKNNTSSIESAFNQKALKYFDVNFVFGEEIKKSILNIHGETKTDIIISGEPRFDLLKEKFNGFFSSIKPKFDVNYDQFFLINTSFSASNPKAGKEYLKNYWLNEPTFSDKTKRLLMEKIDFIDIVLQDYLSAIEMLAKKIPNTLFVIRPHPSESLKIYESKFKPYKNIKITNEGNVAQWIKKAKSIIHFDCTTGIEAHLANKPVIAYTPQYNENVVAWLPVAISKRVNTENDLYEQVLSIIENKFEHQISEDVIDTLNKSIHNFVDDSSPIISNYLLEKANNMKPPTSSTSSIYQIYKKQDYNLRMLVKSIIYKIKNETPINVKKKGTFRVSEISKKLNFLTGVNNGSKKYKVKFHTLNSVNIKS